MTIPCAPGASRGLAKTGLFPVFGLATGEIAGAAPPDLRGNRFRFRSLSQIVDAAEERGNREITLPVTIRNRERTGKGPRRRKPDLGSDAGARSSRISKLESPLGSPMMGLNPLEITQRRRSGHDPRTAGSPQGRPPAGSGSADRRFGRSARRRHRPLGHHADEMRAIVGVGVDVRVEAGGGD